MAEQENSFGPGHGVDGQAPSDAQRTHQAEDLHRLEKYHDFSSVEPEINMVPAFGDIENLLNLITEASLKDPTRPPLSRNASEDVIRDGIKDERSVRSPRDAFSILLRQALDLGLEEVFKAGSVNIRIATMCSGTDGPILALREFQEAAAGLGHPNRLNFEHVFSCEIEPFKQLWIQRNTPPSGSLFRNVVDLGKPGASQAMTADGYMAKIPEMIDVLIAGSSCVDFSSLNNKKELVKKASGLHQLYLRYQKDELTAKAVNEDPVVTASVIDDLNHLAANLHKETGESTKTFVSILNYIQQRRPRVVILENVATAPFDKFANFWFPAIGYCAGFSQADSKNFLVPQTRQRKYLLAVDGRMYGEHGPDIVKNWVKLMHASNWFKAPPRLQNFLLPPSDSRVLHARFALERNLGTKIKKEYQAILCRMEHFAARRHEGLPPTNPYTLLDSRGSVQPREDSWRGYINAITWRMQDLLDIEYLRAQKKGFDFNWKTVVLDLGQNVDRQNSKLGVMPCILPSADLFLTDHGRPVLGIECLAMQGIPIDRVSIATQKEAQLKDLAGNAMTTTVAGAAFLCALTSVYRGTLKAPGTFNFFGGSSMANLGLILPPNNEMHMESEHQGQDQIQPIAYDGDQPFAFNPAFLHQGQGDFAYDPVSFPLQVQDAIDAQDSPYQWTAQDEAALNNALRPGGSVDGDGYLTTGVGRDGWGQAGWVNQDEVDNSLVGFDCGNQLAAAGTPASAAYVGDDLGHVHSPKTPPAGEGQMGPAVFSFLDPPRPDVSSNNFHYYNNNNNQLAEGAINNFTIDNNFLGDFGPHENAADQPVPNANCIVDDLNSSHADGHQVAARQQGNIAGIADIGQIIAAQQPVMKFKDAALCGLPDEAKTVAWFCDLCRKGRSYCACDDFRRHEHAGTYLRCEDCETIRCVTCAGNPEHNYDKEHSFDTRYAVSKDVSRQLATASLPARLMIILTGSNMQFLPELDDRVFGNHRDVLRKAIKTCAGGVHYYLSDIKFRSEITATYDSEKAYIVLVITEKSVTWNIHLREVFSHPNFLPDLATSEAAQLLDALNYDLFIQEKIKVGVEQCQISHETLVLQQELISIPWNLGVTEDDFVDLRGTFEYTDKCATPLGRLFVRKQPDLGHVYHMLHSDPVTSAAEDRWVLTNNAQKPEADQVHDIMAVFGDDYIPFGKDGENQHQLVSVTVPGIWRPLEPSSKLYLLELAPVPKIALGQLTTQILAGNGCRPVPSILMRLDVPDMKFRNISLSVKWIVGSVSSINDNGRGVEETWIPVAKHELKDALGLVAHAANKIAPNTEAMGGPNTNLDISDFPMDLCFRCSPLKSGTLHSWNDDGTVTRVEVEHMAAAVAAALRNRPDPFLVEAWIKPSVSDPRCPSILNMRISLNPLSLMHRALGHLPYIADAMSAFVRSSTARGSYRVEYSFSDPSLKDLEPFNRSMQAISAQEYPSPIMQPPNFLRNGMALRDDQRRAVQWMLERESTQEPFMEQEFEECIMPSVDIRLHAAAQVNNYARGGVLAHDIGYGKTIVTLGLIDITSADPQNEIESIQQRMQWCGNSKIHIKGTLIFVPSHLVSQWANEATRFVGGKGSLVVLTITRPTDIVREKMIAADIIIVSNALMYADRMLEKMAAVSKLPVFNPKRSAMKGKEFESYYSEYLRTLSAANFDFTQPGLTSRDDLEAKITAYRSEVNDLIRSATTENVGSSDRKKQQTAKGKPTEAAKQKANARPKKVQDIDLYQIFAAGELLQLYTVRRVVVDEFSYEELLIAAVLKNCVASSKWILSATPPTTNLAQICETAMLINVHVAHATSSIPGYFPKVTVGPSVGEQTDAEKFRSYSEILSAQFARERHQQAQRFVRHFFRKNPTNLEDIDVEERIHIVPMNPQESQMYNVVQQICHDAKWDLNETRSSLAPFIQGLLDSEASSMGGVRAKTSGKSIYTDAIDALLLLSSVSVAYGRPGLETMDYVGQNNILTLRNISGKYARSAAMYLMRCCQILKSHFDLMMYLAEMLAHDPTNRSPSRKAKEDAYMGHMNDIINIFKENKTDALGSIECFRFVKSNIATPRADDNLTLSDDAYWDHRTWARAKGGFAKHDAVEWFLLRDDENLSDDEWKAIGRRWVNGEQDVPQEDVIRAVQAKQLDFANGNNNFMTSSLGLKQGGLANANMSSILRKHFESSDKDGTKDKSDADTDNRDFEFGIRLRLRRPIQGREIRPRGQKIDETLNHFMLVIQSILNGLKIISEAFRRNVFAMKTDVLNKCQYGALGGLAITCNMPHRHQMSDLSGLQSIACGHTICPSCHDALIASGSSMCPIPGCLSLSGSSFIPWRALVGRDNDFLDDDLAAMPSAKVSRIEDIIFDQVQPDEKVLIFAAYNGIKQEIATYLRGEHGGRLGIYMTNGSNEDSANIDGFKRHNGRAVLIQSLMSSESAGTNLTEANHIIFSGVLCTDNDSYEMYMRQAKGRLMRYGQTRKVNVYHIISPGTIEFDIMNKRHDGQIRNRGGEDGLLVPIPNDTATDYNYPLMYRPWIDNTAVQKLLGSIDFEEFESH
ncbi:hypothetical protein CCHL11_08467 [Colletotrichum chlorophyti]|uniref:B box-type domain-containing protein n=1 Tax=Colletotrichum chlorophyti TaxID=708187 RepID=A0A1Q8RQB0_9PEZI|nr:hypothetical protein CCHL11_08467 [Colletotrichum chlorophyti]